MRNPPLKYLWAALPVIAVATGSFIYLRSSHNDARSLDASAKKVSSEKHEVDAKHEKSAKSANRSKSHGDARLDELAELDDAEREALAENRRSRAEAPDEDSAPPADVVSGEERSRDNVCAPIEFRGHGPDRLKPSSGEWARLMESFHDLKSAYAHWLERNSAQIGPKLAKELATRIEETRIQRPPVMEELDLTWRGVGVWTQNASDEPLIKLGSGYLRLVANHPARARFELARLIAQSLAPCELARAGSESPWTPLMSCLGVTAECGAGSYGEYAWAVSTALAAQVASPGCTIPAAAAPTVGACFAKIPFKDAGKTVQVERPFRVSQAHPAAASDGASK